MEFFQQDKEGEIENIEPLKQVLKHIVSMALDDEIEIEMAGSL